jgi:hypothetical protein
MKKYSIDVHSKNEMKKIAIAEIKNILPQLTQYLGKRIDTQTGLSKKFVVNLSKNVPEAIENGFAMVQFCYLSVNYGKLMLKISLCFNGGKYEDGTYYCHYYKRDFELGNVNNFLLTSIFDLDNIVNDYQLNDIINLEEEEQKITKYKQLEEELRQLKYSIKIEF